METKYYVVKVYTTWNTTRSWSVVGLDKAREYAKRIITEGLWYKDEDTEVFVPVHNLVKAKVIPVAEA